MQVDRQNSHVDCACGADWTEFNEEEATGCREDKNINIGDVGDSEKFEAIEEVETEDISADDDRDDENGDKIEDDVVWVSSSSETSDSYETEEDEEMEE